MNIGISAVLFFSILAPGFIFRSRFRRAERSSLDYSPFGEVAVNGVLYSAVLHIAWLAGAFLFFDRVIRLDVLAKLLSPVAELQREAIGHVQSEQTLILVYFVSLFTFAAIAPPFLAAAITHFRLDRRGHALSKLCRFHAPWYYLLSTRDFAADEVPSAVVVSTIVEIGKEPYLYVGLLREFFAGSDGQLDRVVLEVVSRRMLSDDHPPETPDPEGNGAQKHLPPVYEQDDNGGNALRLDTRFYPVAGDYFVIRYSEMITLNVFYLRTPAA